MPLRWDTNTLFFADIRGVVDGKGASEANVGLGLRKLDNKNGAINGMYAFFDRRRSYFDNYFSQFTIGAERLTKNWDFRTNIYLPVGRVKDVGQLPATSYLAGSSIFVESGLVQERALKGIDVEVGHTLFGNEDARIFFGGYRFWGEDVPEVKGVRGRVHLDINEHIRIGGEMQHDHVRGTNSYAEVRLRFPFGKNRKTKLTGLRARMVEPIVRDIDIVTQQGNTPVPQIYEAVNTTTGNPQKIYFVKNDVATNGDGSLETPFDNLDDAVAAAGAYDKIYVFYGDGTSTNLDTGITLATDNVTLLGEGVALTYDTSNLSIAGDIPLPSDGYVIQAAGNKPNLTKDSGIAVRITADNVGVAGFLIDRSAVGIRIDDAENAYLHDLLISGNSTRGLWVRAAGAEDASIKMERVAAVGNYDNIKFADGSTGQITADLGGGPLGSSGNNDIFGASNFDVTSDLDGGTLYAQNNYYGEESGGAITWTTGPDAARIDASGNRASPTCSDCVTPEFSFVNVTAPTLSFVYSNEITLSGFAGQQYAYAFGGGLGSIWVNGINAGSMPLVKSGDTIKIRQRTPGIPTLSNSKDIWLANRYVSFTVTAQ